MRSTLKTLKFTPARPIIIFGLIAIVGASVASCHSPPPREAQCKDYVTLNAISSTSDRIVTGELLSENRQTIEPDDSQPFILIYRTYRVADSMKGSAEKDDEVHVAFPESVELFLSGGEDDPLSFSVGETHTLFLKGRARATEYPNEYGGTLWTLNGEPAIAVSDSSGTLSFAVTSRYARTVGKYGAPFTATLSQFPAQQS